ncbi:hypothetical protein ES707_13183 [subsurface metagenome]
MHLALLRATISIPEARSLKEKWRAVRREPIPVQMPVSGLSPPFYWEGPHGLYGIA